jgi:hypothetical protein
MVPVHARVRRGKDRGMRLLAAGKSNDLEQYVRIARNTMTQAKARALYPVALRTDAGEGRLDALLQQNA